MEILAIFFSSLLAFVFGVVATSFGARLGKALDARKEMLNEMRDWIDKIQDYVNLLYQNVQGTSYLAWSDNDRAELAKFRIASSARWLGISKTIGSKELMDATQEYIKAEYKFEEIYFTKLAQLAKDNPNYSKIFMEFADQNNLVTNQAEFLHGVITREVLGGIPQWLLRREI